jgi:hypothetical protein
VFILVSLVTVHAAGDDVAWTLFDTDTILAESGLVFGSTLVDGWLRFMYLATSGDAVDIATLLIGLRRALLTALDVELVVVKRLAGDDNSNFSVWL